MFARAKTFSRPITCRSIDLFSRDTVCRIAEWRKERTRGNERVGVRGRRAREKEEERVRSRMTEGERKGDGKRI